MVEIRKENVHRIVEEHEFNEIWKAKGFEIVTENPQAETQEEVFNIDELKAEADVLGISYMPNIGAKKLAERIAEFKANN